MTTESFDKSCAYCGARFRVLASHGPFADHAEEYACPECGKRYDTQAAHRPRVELLMARSDGKEDSYQDTMF
jgi:DNA-directed RNA polymerase subunit RPC12/RpoP